MTENLPAVPETATPAAPAERAPVAADVDSWIQVMRPVIALAETIAGTEFVPKGLRNSVPATAAAMLYGREVGLPPMTALTQTHVIEGKPSMSAEAMRALVLAAGHEIVFDQADGGTCRMRARRAGGTQWTEVAWTIDMARAAGLANKQVWKSYPRAMLVARCTVDLCRMVFPDVIHGFRGVEEFDSDADTAPAVEAPSAPTSKVARKRTPAKTAAALPSPEAEAPKERPAPAPGPPLPGEEGFEGRTTPAPAVSAEVPVPPQSPEGVDVRSREGDDVPLSGTADDSDDGAREVGPVSAAQIKMVQSLFSKMGMGTDASREQRLALTSSIVGRDVESTTNLSKAEAHRLLDTLTRIESPEQLQALVQAAADGVVVEDPPEDAES